MSPLPPRRSHDIGFSDAVTDMVDIVKHETSRRGRARGIVSFDKKRIRGMFKPFRPIQSDFYLLFKNNYNF